MTRYRNEGLWYVPDDEGQYTLQVTAALQLSELHAEDSPGWRLNAELHELSRFPMPVIELQAQRFTLIDPNCTHTARLRTVMAAANFDALLLGEQVFPLGTGQVSEYHAPLQAEDVRHLVVELKDDNAEQPPTV